jgi:hypothetical protein
MTPFAKSSDGSWKPLAEVELEVVERELKSMRFGFTLCCVVAVAGMLILALLRIK